MALGLLDAALIAVALGFAVSIGAHYTGACVGMAYAAGAIRRSPALVGMAILTFVGAAVASGRVIGNIGENLVDPATFRVVDAFAAVAAAFGLTSIYNFVRLPTSTIQIFVFSVVGSAVGAGLPVAWGVVGGVAVVWALAPVAAVALGYLFTKAFDARTSPSSEIRGAGTGAPAMVLVSVGLAASFAMGANDVANATSVLVTVGAVSVLLAGAIGGIFLSIGVVTWGRALLERVAFDILHLDRSMASGAQFAQVAVILVSAVGLGVFTSMNQALVGAMAGAGLARGRQTVKWPMVRGILAGWAVGPVSGYVLGFVALRALSALGVS